MPAWNHTWWDILLISYHSVICTQNSTSAHTHRHTHTHAGTHTHTHAGTHTHTHTRAHTTDSRARTHTHTCMHTHACTHTHTHTHTQGCHTMIFCVHIQCCPICFVWLAMGSVSLSPLPWAVRLRHGLLVTQHSSHILAHNKHELNASWTIQQLCLNSPEWLGNSDMI